MTGAELNFARFLQAQLEREQRRLQDLQVMAESMTPIFDGMPHVKPQTFKTERMALLIVGCQKKIELLTEQLVQTKFDLLTKLQAINLDEQSERVLSYRYVACLTLKAIAKLMNCTSDYVWKMHKRGLRLLGLTLSDVKEAKTSTTVDSCQATVGGCQS